MKHGTSSGYSYHGCRCDECRAGGREYRLALRARNGVSPPAPRLGRRHGTPSEYNNWGCRCEPCVEAWRVARRRARENRLLATRLDLPSVPHGTLSGYSAWGCRCEKCRRAGSDWGKAQRLRTATTEALLDELRRRGVVVA